MKLEQELQDPRMAEELGVSDAAAEPLNQDLIGDWVEWMVGTKGLSPNTIRLYRRTVELFSAEISDFLYAQEETIQEWLQAKGGQPGTFCNRVSGLMSFYSYARKSKLILANPCADLDKPKTHKRLPKPVEDLQRALFLADREDEKAAVRLQNHPTMSRRVGETRDMIIFLCYTGFRIHEAVKCDWPVPCPEEAFVIGKGSKEELVQIPDKAREAWDRLGGSWPIKERATQRRFERCEIHPHMCRHWRATSLVRAGVEIGQVSKIMRHSSVATTMGYSAYAKEQARAALDLVP